MTRAISMTLRLSLIFKEVHDRIAQLVREHKTTLVFVNTRRQVERVAHALGQRLGARFCSAGCRQRAYRRRKAAGYAQAGQYQTMPDEHSSELLALRAQRHPNANLSPAL